MSEDSSSDEEWCVSTTRQVSYAHREAKCLECGKKFSNITNLMSHYKSHNIVATCHVCNVIFRRWTSLSTHLDNAHFPPLCKKCHQSFSNVRELNKHAETHCLSPAPFQGAPSLISAVIYQSQKSDISFNKVPAQHRTNSVQRDFVQEMRPQERVEMKPERLETSENSVEYIVGEDDKDFDSDWEKANDDPGDLESDGGSSSTDCSSDTSNTKKTPFTPPNDNTSVCAMCGRGPFRSMKLHLLHCSGVRVKYQCSLCKKLFVTETSLNEHYMPLYSCHICGQVFSHEISYHEHQCPKENKSPLVLFCSETMPKVCNICKSFFTCEKTLLNHVTRVHTSVVSRKVLIITKPSALTDKNASPGVCGTTTQPFISSPNAVSQVINGELHTGQTYAGPLSTIVKSSPASSFHPGRPPAPICMAFPAPVKSVKNGILSQPTNQLQNNLSAPLFDSHSTTDTTLAAVATEHVSPPMPTILAMFENDSQDVAFMKRMNTGWRFKAPYPCRQCGAIFRQPSLIISHRYLHRGRRSHQCQCGRAFKHRLHLLRHCVQHAEAISYICVSCGETFTGARLLAEHMRGKSRKKSRSGRTWKHKVKTKCKIPFTCDCGQLFFRPSAYIWHQLKNWKKNKQMKNPLK